MSRYLSQDEVLLLHDLVLELDGGSAGVLSPAALEAALAQPMMEAFGHKRYLSLFDEAAAYLFYLSRAHAFVDGNKRTAFLAMVLFLHLNGVALEARDEELFQLCLGAAQGKLDLEEIGLRLRKCSR